jgi:hypothetical protein
MGTTLKFSTAFPLRFWTSAEAGLKYVPNADPLGVIV